MTAAQDTLAAAHASWNAGDLDGYLELYDDRIRLHGYSPEPMGKAEVRGFYAATFAAFDSPQLDFHEVLWDGAACTIRFTGWRDATPDRSRMHRGQAARGPAGYDPRGSTNVATAPAGSAYEKA